MIRRWVAAGFLALCSVFFADSASWAVSPQAAQQPDASPSASSSLEPSPSPVEPTPEASSEPSPSSSPSPTSEPASTEPVVVSSVEGEPTVVTLALYDASVILLGFGLLVALQSAALVTLWGRD